MFEKVSENIFIRPYERYSDRPNIGLICGKEQSMLYDAGNSCVHVKAMQKDLSDLGISQPDYVALSHWHWDHTFGACAWNSVIVAGRDTDSYLRKMRTWQWDGDSMNDRLNRGIEITFCHEMILREYSDPSLIQIRTGDIVFDNRLTIDLGNVTCELIHAGGPHSEDSVICYVPSEGFVFLGDSYGKDLYGLPWHFNINNERDFSNTVASLPYDYNRVESYLKILDALDFSRCIGGHGKVMSREELYQKLL